MPRSKPVNGRSPADDCLTLCTGAGFAVAVTFGLGFAFAFGLVFTLPVAFAVAAFTFGCSLAMDTVLLSYCVSTGFAPATGAPTIATKAPPTRAAISRLFMITTIPRYEDVSTEIGLPERAKG